MSDSTIPQGDDAPNQPIPAQRFETPPGFELLDEVGRGGMGVVYRARDLGLDREVAVKFLQERFAPDSPAAARFIKEAHITGQLQHPGVPAVHHVGALGDGRPYLVMKLIGGNTLEELLKQRMVVDPLSIFEAAAQTVGYAHAHGVIHRDLKPANVMVGDFGEAQVMDWGLAKALADPEARPASAGDPEATTDPNPIRPPRHSDDDRTRAGSVMGTPAYMAPEQAAGETDKVDARADVFGLGAILCALLTGKPPYVGQDSESVRLAAARGQTEEAFARLDASGADPDIIALCKRCLAFEPDARPATGDAVADELASLRRAADERARRAERDRHAALARVEEQAKRRRAILWAAGVVVAAMLLGVVGTGIGLYRAVAAQRAAEARRLEAEAARAAETRQRELAEAKEAEANAVVQFFDDHVFAAGRPKGQAGGLGDDVSLRDAVLASLPSLDNAFPNQPLVEARLRMALGVTFLYLGETARAAEQVERARTLFARHNGPNHPATLETTNSLANAYRALGRPGVASKLLEETLAARRRVLPPDHPDTLKSMTNLANSYYALGRREEALKLLEETLAAFRRQLPPDHPDTLTVMNNLASCYLALGRREEALKLHEATLAGRRRALPPDHPDTLASMHNLADALQTLGRPAEAVKLLEETLTARRRVLPLDHPDTLMSMTNLANGYYALGRREEAVKLLEETLAAFQRVLPPDHPNTLTVMNNLASCYLALGRREEALTLHEKTLAARRRVLPPNHPDTLVSMSNLADDYNALGRPAEALKLLEETLAAQKQALPPGHSDTLLSLVNMAESLVALDRGAEALPLIDEVLAKAVGRAVDPRLVPAAIAIRLRHFQKIGDPDGCRATAAIWENLNHDDADGLYNAACMRAVAAATRTRAGDDAERLAKDDADRAMDWLKKAVAAGFADKAQIKQDTDLDALRDRDDFKTLLKKMEDDQG